MKSELHNAILHNKKTYMREIENIKLIIEEHKKKEKECMDDFYDLMESIDLKEYLENQLEKIELRLSNFK